MTTFENFAPTRISLVQTTTSAPGTPARVAPTTGEENVEQPCKRRHCGVCREEGHNSR